jgi:hypothetical protein
VERVDPASVCAPAPADVVMRRGRANPARVPRARPLTASQPFARRARKVVRVPRVGGPALAENWSRARGSHCVYSAGGPGRERYEGGTDWRRPETFRAVRSMPGPYVSSVRMLAVCNGNAREGYDRVHILALPGGQARE